MKAILSLLLLVSFHAARAQNFKATNSADSRYRQEIYIPVTHSLTGEPMSDQKVDNVQYKKIDGQYYKKATITEITPQLFGARGNSKYNSTGDINQLLSGTDDTQPIADFLAARNRTSQSGSKMGGSALYFPASVYKVQGSFMIDDSNTSLFGDGSGSSIIHAVKNENGDDRPVFQFKKSNAGSSYDDLLTGGGIEKMALRTDNAHNRMIAINIVFAEYMTFRDLNIEGFGKSAVKGGFWESYFDNVKISACGASQSADQFGNPAEGIIDTSNDNPKRPDGSNNTLFNKLTFSSNFGTWLKLTSKTAQTVNFNINGFYGESYYGDAGEVDNLPAVYVSNATGNTIANGFFTINSTGVERTSHVVVMNEISELKLSNLTITFNPIQGFLKRPVRKLRAIASLKTINSNLSLRDVVISDQVDAVGYGLYSAPPLLEGKGICSLNNVTFKLLAASSGGTRRLTNIVDRNLRANGDFYVIPNDANGEIPSLMQKVQLNSGLVTVYGNELPNTPDTWAAGDRVLKTNFTSSISVGWICTEPGTSGAASAKGNITKGSTQLTVTNTAPFLIGDWIKIEGMSEYNRVKSIEKNLLILEQKSSKTVTSAQVAFYGPKWTELKCS